MEGSNVAAIVVAVVGGAFGVWSAYISSNTKKSTKKIKSVLENTKGPVDSLDAVISIMQKELTDSRVRHEAEIKYLNTQVDELRDDLKICESARATITVEFDDLKRRLRRIEETTK